MAINSNIKELTKAEEQVMQELWKLKQAFVKDIVQELPDPKPAVNTVSTIVRILEQKGFVGHTAKGRSFQYHPLITRDDYASFVANNVISKYFGDSAEKLLSFFVKEKKMDLTTLDEVLKQMNKEK